MIDSLPPSVSGFVDWAAMLDGGTFEAPKPDPTDPMQVRIAAALYEHLQQCNGYIDAAVLARIAMETMRDGS